MKNREENLMKFHAFLTSSTFHNKASSRAFEWKNVEAIKWCEMSSHANSAEGDDGLVARSSSYPGASTWKCLAAKFPSVSTFNTNRRNGEKKNKLNWKCDENFIAPVHSWTLNGAVIQREAKFIE